MVSFLKKRIYRRPELYIVLAFIVLIVLIVVPSNNNVGKVSDLQAQMIEDDADSQVIDANKDSIALREMDTSAGAPNKDANSNQQSSSEVANSAKNNPASPQSNTSSEANTNSASNSNSKGNNTSEGNALPAETRDSSSEQLNNADDKKAASAGDTSAKVNTINVSTMKVVLKNYPITETVIGEVYTDNINYVSSEVSGQIIKLSVQLGDQVKKGDLIAVISNRELENNKKSAIADKESLKAQITLQQNTVSRYKTLFESGFIAKVELEDAELQLITFNKKLVSLESSLKNIDIANNKLRVKASISGVIQEKNASAGDFIAVGSPIVKIVDNSSLKVVASIAEGNEKYIKIGSKVDISGVNNASNRVIKGTIRSIKPALENVTRMLQIIIDVEGDKLPLKPSSVVNVNVILQTIENAVLLPYNAVVLRPVGTVVYVLSKQRPDLGEGIYEVQQKQIKVKELGNGFMLETSKILRNNEVIVLEGAGFLTDKAIIKVSE